MFETYLSKLKNLLNSGHERSLIIKRSIVASFFIKFINIITGIILVPLTINYIDPNRYGIWLTLSSTLVWIGFFDIGISNGLRNKLSAALAKKNDLLAKEYISTSYLLLTIIISVVVSLFFITEPYIKWYLVFNADIKYSHDIKLMVKSVFFIFSLRFVFQLISTILLADLKPATSNLLNLFSNLLTLVIIIFLKLFTSGSLFLLGVAVSISPVTVFVIASAILFSGNYKKYLPSISYVKLKYTKSLLALGVNFFVIQIAALILFTANNFILAQFYNPIEVTRYNISYKYFTVILMIFNIITTPFWSGFTNAFAQEDYKWIKSVVAKLRKIWLILSFIVIIMLLFSQIAYKFWIGNDIHIPFALSTSLAIFIIIITFNSIYVNFLNGVGKIRIQLFHSIFVILVNIPLEIVLIKYSNLGPTSVVIANISCQIIGSVWAPIQYKKIIQKKAFGIWNK